ncbi:MAG: hypothetical protein RL722_93 [Pseudomonadota bacterium]|jgi:hemerythrin-like domain-containing protein
MAALTAPHQPAERNALPAAVDRSFEDDFEALDREHQLVLDHLVILKRMVADLDARGVDAGVQAQAKAAVHFFDTTAHHHHAEEDRVVFPPLLEGTDADLADKVKRLQQDHRWLEQDWAELKLQVDAIAKGYSWYEIDALRAAVEVYIALYLDHIDLEESIVYPQARRRLAERADAGEARRAAASRRETAAS